MQLIKYDAMCQAIAECERVDEVKDIRDKAMAIEAYAKQAMNTAAERQACNVRLRAEREVGRRLKEMEKAKAPPGPGRGNKSRSHNGTAFSDTPTLSNMGISKGQSSRWQKLASVKDDVFEEALADPKEKPSTNGLIKKANGSKAKMDPLVLWLWGRMRDFESKEIQTYDIAYLLSEMTETMQADIYRIAPIMADFFYSLGAENADTYKQAK